MAVKLHRKTAPTSDVLGDKLLGMRVVFFFFAVVAQVVKLVVPFVHRAAYDPAVDRIAVQKSTIVLAYTQHPLAVRRTADARS